MESRSGGVASPVADFSQAFADGVFEESHFVAGVFELMDAGQDLARPPAFAAATLPGRTPEAQILGERRN
jgi:hypothetical protein